MVPLSVIIDFFVSHDVSVLGQCSALPSPFLILCKAHSFAILRVENRGAQCIPFLNQRVKDDSLTVDFGALLRLTKLLNLYIKLVVGLYLLLERGNNESTACFLLPIDFDIEYEAVSRVNVHDMMIRADLGPEV